MVDEYWTATVDPMKVRQYDHFCPVTWMRTKQRQRTLASQRKPLPLYLQAKEGALVVGLCHHLGPLLLNDATELNRS